MKYILTKIHTDTKQLSFHTFDKVENLMDHLYGMIKYTPKWQIISIIAIHNELPENK